MRPLLTAVRGQLPQRMLRAMWAGPLTGLGVSHCIRYTPSRCQDTAPCPLHCPQRNMMHAPLALGSGRSIIANLTINSPESGGAWGNGHQRCQRIVHVGQPKRRVDGIKGGEFRFLFFFLICRSDRHNPFLAGKLHHLSFFFNRLALRPRTDASMQLCMSLHTRSCHLGMAARKAAVSPRTMLRRRRRPSL